ERATDGSQASENWGLFMEVCDTINETDEGPKDAIKAIRKRLSQNMGKNHTAVMYTLTCLESCVKNCGRRFHLHVAKQDFLGELVKVIGPKYDPPQVVQEKVLSLIQTWADAFRGIPELKEVEKVYNDLKAKGIEFPMTDLDNLAPIHTPARTLSEVDPGLNRLRQQSTRTPQPPPPAVAPVTPVQAQLASGPVNPSPEQIAKLKSELNVVQGNIRVMGEMLTELQPSSVDSSDLELLQELHRTNRQMQQRLVDLLDKVANEEVTNELLRINDDMNNVFVRYDRFERYRTGQTGGSSSQLTSLAGDTPSATSPPAPVPPPAYDQVNSSGPKVGNLIDLGDDSAPANDVQPITSQVANMNMASNPAKPDDDFDMFAQSRQSFDTNKQNLGTYSNQKEDQMAGGLRTAVNAKSGVLTREEEEVLQLQDKETDYDEMEQWLTAEQKASLKAELNKPQEPMSSSEFDTFLAEQTSGANTVPSIPAATGQRNTNRNRQLQKDDEENPLFAL
ncbi:hypothetical protein FSP39_009722, partial [Pinctada imbricata]